MSVSVKTKQDLFAVLSEHQAEMRRRGVKRIGVFGSFARDVVDDQSDVDFLVEFEPEQKTFDNFMRLSFLLETWLHRRVELVTLESLSPYIGPHITQEVEYVALGT